MRIDKFFSSMGIRTRTEIKGDLKKCKVKVNGMIIKKPDFVVDEQKDIVEYEGQVFKYEEFVYYVLNKPQGVVTARSDKEHRTVMDLIDDPRAELSPVGRLDKDTEGMLIITNDGGLLHNLMSPKKHVLKRYYAVIDGIVTNEDIKIFSEGVDIGDEKLTLPAKLEVLEKGDSESKIEITIEEGRYHQVKRMFEAIGKKVIYLKRLAIGNFDLPLNLKEGEYIKITKEELIEKIYEEK